jgi:hypothetical protein
MCRNQFYPVCGFYDVIGVDRTLTYLNDQIVLATSTNGTVWDPRDQGWGRAWVNSLKVRL